MSKENVELFYEANDAFNRRDLDALLALADPDIEWFPRIAELEAGAPIAAMTVSDTGGRAGSPSPPTSAGRSRRYETSVT